jgi:hypothetical protein
VEANTRLGGPHSQGVGFAAVQLLAGVGNRLPAAADLVKGEAGLGGVLHVESGAQVLLFKHHKGVGLLVSGGVLGWGVTPSR